MSVRTAGRPQAARVRADRRLSVLTRHPSQTRGAITIITIPSKEHTMSMTDHLPDECLHNWCGHVDTDAPTRDDHGHMTPPDWSAVVDCIQHAIGLRSGPRNCYVCHEHDERDPWGPDEDGYTLLDRLPALEAMSTYANDIEPFYDDPGMAGPEV